jgi:hypothetical protein
MATTLAALAGCAASQVSAPPSAVPAAQGPRPSTTPTPRPSVAIVPEPSVPGPSVPAPIHEDLSGIPTTAERAHRYPIAVMLDDAPAARPQAGLAEASIVWQAPVEGGIARYMAVYQAGEPPSIGPVRSARLYFVRWAAEWKALFLHAGGPPPLKLWLRGDQDLVVNADGKRTARVSWRAAPHNLYSTARGLRSYAQQVGARDDRLAYDPAAAGALQPFRDGAPEAARGRDRSRISFTYASERVIYTYDRASNVWLRSVDGKPQFDAGPEANRGRGTKGAGPRIAPTTVIVMVVPIRRSARIDGPALGRLVADSIGSNKAWVFADGRVVSGTWAKKDPTSRTRFLDADGAEIVLPRGQIFVQVIPKTSAFDHTVEPAP